jgi:hypothetical protein
LILQISENICDGFIIVEGRYSWEYWDNQLIQLKNVIKYNQRSYLLTWRCGMNKIFLLGILTVLALVVGGCGKSNPNQIQVSANTAFDLAVGKTAIVKGESISIKFDSVTEDSRCPTGVTCIWAGQAKCNMSVVQNGVTTPVVLTQSGGSEGTMQGFAGKYQVSFLLNPYPRAGSQIKPQDYVLSMKLFQ